MNAPAAFARRPDRTSLVRSQIGPQDVLVQYPSSYLVRAADADAAPSQLHKVSLPLPCKESHLHHMDRRACRALDLKRAVQRGYRLLLGAVLPTSLLPTVDVSLKVNQGRTALALAIWVAVVGSESSSVSRFLGVWIASSLALLL